MIVRTLFLIALFVATVPPLFAKVIVSVESGRWSTIQWSPSELPGVGDTVVIATAVTEIPPSQYGVIIIAPGASLETVPGLYLISGLKNYGYLRLLPGVAVKSSGDVLNDGIISDRGALELTSSGGSISGGGTISNLIINTGSSENIRAESSLTLGTLYVATGQLLIGEHHLTVEESFTSAVPYGEPGIVAATGSVELNGPANGSVYGNVQFGWVTGEGTPKHPTPPSTHGKFGCDECEVNVVASRRVSFGEFSGSVVVDSGVVVTIEGIGEKGSATFRGDLLNQGSFAATNDLYFLRVGGDLRNEGVIDHCTVLMTGHEGELRTNSGLWGYDASLEYRASSGGRLQVYGSMVVPRLTIGTLAPSDSGVVVAVGQSLLTVRHTYRSDQARGCGLISDTLVRLRKDVAGVVTANILFEGFFNSEISGTFGGIGRVVQMAMPKRIVGPTHFAGTFQQTPNGKLTVRSEAELPPGTTLAADLMVDTGGMLQTSGALTLLRSGSGGGALTLLGLAASLDVRGELLDSLHLHVGNDTTISHLTFLHAVDIPNMTVHPNSTFSYPQAIAVHVINEFRYCVEVGPGYGLYSPAVIPDDPTPSVFFSGANSDVFVIDESLSYSVADTIEVGRGYWVSFPERLILEERGKMIDPPITVSVNDGWNVVGATSIPLLISDIEKSGTVELSPYFEYREGYVPATVLLPGRGYLVELDGAGTLLLK
ncbi:MAG: hypothetical protein AB7H80_05170 [Candidatus Kapaibacterium sp.]